MSLFYSTGTFHFLPYAFNPTNDIFSLGVLGFLPPTSASTINDPNLGLKDVILGLKAINQYIEYVGGNRAEITIGGQSSGAGLIRGG